MSGAEDVDDWVSNIVEGFFVKTFWKNVVIGRYLFLTYQSIVAEVVIL